MPNFNIEVSKIAVVTGSGPDKLVIQTANLTPPFSDYEFPADIQVLVSQGYGKSWAEKNFPGVAIEVIQMRGRDIG